MRTRIKAGLAAASALLAASAGAWACGFQHSAEKASALQLAQAGDAARPARGPQSESSVTTGAPPASATQTTGATNQPPVVKQMNEEEKQKVEKEGK
jgi:ABC-type phosphate/phosphonate transport system substrate-binding protein